MPPPTSKLVGEDPDGVADTDVPIVVQVTGIEATRCSSTLEQVLQNGNSVGDVDESTVTVAITSDEGIEIDDYDFAVDQVGSFVVVSINDLVGDGRLSCGIDEYHRGAQGSNGSTEILRDIKPMAKIFLFLGVCFVFTYLNAVH